MSNAEFSRRLELSEAEKDLDLLKKSQIVPPLMLAKLEFLMSLIEIEKVNESIVEQLPYYERQTLEELPLDAQTDLFVSIIRCLSGKEIVTFFKGERGFLRKQKAFFGWKKCYIDCNSKEVVLFQSRKTADPFQRLQISQLWISRTYKYYKKKYIFAVYYLNVKYVLGFNEELTCKRVHEILTSLICENREWQCTKFSRLEPESEGQFKKLGPESRQVEEAILSEELEYLCSIQERLNLCNISDHGFKLLRNVQHGRILSNQTQGSIKISLILKNINELSLLEAYMMQTAWNSNMQTFTILGKPRTNSYIGYMKTNKYSLISYPRDCFISIVYYRPCECRTQANTSNSYLIIESIENESEPPQSGVVRMKFSQVIEISKSKEDESMLLMSITTEADFKGYSSVSDNIAMSLHLLNNIPEFIKQAEKKERRAIFQQEACPCKGEGKNRNERIVSDFSVPTEQSVSNVDELSDIGERGPRRMSAVKKVSLRFDKAESDNEVVLILDAVLKGVRNESILQVLKGRKHDSYVLRHRFTDQDEVIRTFVGENRDYLRQNNRWDLKGDDFEFINQDVIDAQKDILKMIIKQLGSNLLSGKSIMNMSLPVEIFDKRSMLDVIADSLGFFPSYLTRAVNSQDPVEQMKYVTCAFMFLSATCPNIEKPFNPILGETYQGKVGPYLVNLQQISHHPPISSIYIRNKEFQFHGNFQITVDMGLNSAYSKVNTWLHLHIFSTNTEYKFKNPDIQLGGLMYGGRTLKFAQRGYVYESKNNLFCEMSIGKDKKRVYEAKHKLNPADLAGGIFRVTPEFGAKVKAHTGRKSFDGLKPEDVVENVCFLSGKWYGNLSFNNISYKSITDGPFPDKCFKLKYLLPSDSIFREDIIFKIWKDNPGSNREKQRLENLQRNDRKLRERFNKK